MSDLTRWNRSGLARLRYVQGNAATYLEAIREALARDFGERWQDRLRAPYTAEQLDEVDARWRENLRNAHLIEQYQRERGDLAWELLRAFARSCHVLTEHIDAHANEAFLRSASEWDDVRKMVAMLGYRPAGAISATTLLVIEARARGTVERGLQVRHRLASGGRQIVFETLDDIIVDPALNQLKVAGADTSPSTLGEGADSPSWSLPRRAALRDEDSALLFELGEGAGETLVSAMGVRVDGGSLALEPEDERWQKFTVARSRLASSPRFRRKPWHNGPEFRRSVEPHGLSEGDVVAWRGEGSAGPWSFAMVGRADAFGLELVLPDDLGTPTKKVNAKFDTKWPQSPDRIVVRPASRIRDSLVVPANSLAEIAIGELGIFGVQQLMNHAEGNAVTLTGTPADLEISGTGFDTTFINWLLGGLAFSFPITPDKLVELGAALKTKDARIPSTGQLVFKAFLELFGSPDQGSGAADSWVNGDTNAPLFRFWKRDGTATDPTAPPEPGELWYLPQDHSAVGVPLRELTVINEPDDNWFWFDGGPGDLRAGDWAAARFANTWRAVKILELATPGTGDPVAIHNRHEHNAAFAVRLLLPEGVEQLELDELQGGYRSTTAAPDTGVNTTPAGARIPLEPVDLDLRGRTLLAVDGVGNHQLVDIDDCDEDGIVLSEALPPSFLLGDLRLYGNVVRAGHGERQPDARLDGSTVAGREPTLLLERELVSTIPDESAHRGARADLEVVIDGAHWRERVNLDDSEPTDRHFTTSTTEDGHLELHFGDGRHGRSLPIGTGNVVIRHRVGAGKLGDAGALPPGSLETLVKPHRLVLGVRQPLPAGGGADMEDRARMRERAPAALLALERAVSVGDFEQLAMQAHGVAQARATHTSGGPDRCERIDVAVVATEGTTLDRERVEAYLEQRALPNVRVHVHELPDEHRLGIELDVEVRVDSKVYPLDEVRRAVVDALVERLSLARRRIGEPLHISEVYVIVEEVVGVEDSICSFPDHPDGLVEAGWNDIVYVPGPNSVDCVPKEYVP